MNEHGCSKEGNLCVAGPEICVNRHATRFPTPHYGGLKDGMVDAGEALAAKKVAVASAPSTTTTEKVA